MTKEEFRSALKARGYKQTQFAYEYGVSPQTVRKWLSGKHPVPRWVEKVLLERYA